MAIDFNMSDEQRERLRDMIQAPGIVVNVNVPNGGLLVPTNRSFLELMNEAAQANRDLHDLRQVDPRKMHARVMGKPKQKTTAPDVLKNPTRRILI